MSSEEKNCEHVVSHDAPGSASKSERHWLSYAQLAEVLGVCERTIRREVDAGKLPKPIKIRGCIRFDWQEVEAVLKAGKQR